MVCELYFNRGVLKKLNKHESSQRQSEILQSTNIRHLVATDFIHKHCCVINAMLCVHHQLKDLTFVF